MKTKWLLVCAMLIALPVFCQESLQDLSSEFWTWRATTQPFNLDDIPRIERSAGVKRSWSVATVQDQRSKLLGFERRWKALESSKWPVAQQVDYKLVGSALARVRWELDLNRRWERDPEFYVEQTLSPVHELLAIPPPFSQTQSDEIVSRLENIPSILEEARISLTDPVPSFAKLAVDSLENVRSKLETIKREVIPLLADGKARSSFGPAIDNAVIALEGYRTWLQQQMPAMKGKASVGRDAYVFFLRSVALYPYTPEDLLQMAQQEWARVVEFEHMEKNRNRKVPPLKLAPTIEDEIKHATEDELAVRKFLTEHHILTIPPNFPHYTVRPLPAYLDAMDGWGEMDDFTGPSRLTANCVRWSPPPSEKLGYFSASNARDFRPEIIHEGVPGHYFQLWLSWNHPDPIRRRYYDSGANEGIGFYAEEMMLQDGLFESSPHTREMIYNWARLRALRVEVDVKMALGEFTLDQAADYLHRMVPMDAVTAHDEASSFATTPGQAISYETGKLQITKFFADARREQGDSFDMQAFNDYVWQNGNVPIALQEWEWMETHHAGSNQFQSKKGIGGSVCESNPSKYVDSITYSAADGTKYLVFDRKQSERHGNGTAQKVTSY